MISGFVVLLSANFWTSSASSIRTVLQKNGGRLGETGSTSHLFNNCGIIRIEKNKISEEDAFNIAINSGAKDCHQINNFHEIITNKEDFYKIKTELEKNVETFAYSAIEWRALVNLNLNKDQNQKLTAVLDALEDLDDVQNVFCNAKLNN